MDKPVLNNEYNNIENKAQNNESTILLVDDDPIFRRIASVLLTSLKYNVLEAENGLEALSLLRDNNPDLMICDLSMPILDGMELVEEVSAEYPTLPIVVVSATENMADVARVLRFGIKDFLTKPIQSKENFIAAIESSLETAKVNPEKARDFATQWFKLGDQGELSEEQELYWHLENLQDDKVSACKLLHALQPPKTTELGGWECRYQMLQPAETMPLVFDYAWMPDGRFAFYLVDSNSSASSGIGSTLLIRALFNDFLRGSSHCASSLKDLIAMLERNIKSSQFADPVSALFGMVNVENGFATLLPAGIKGTWSSKNESTVVGKGYQIGAIPSVGFGRPVNTDKLFGSLEYDSLEIHRVPIDTENQFIINDLGLKSFKLSVNKVI